MSQRNVWTTREGLIRRACLYQDKREAIEAARLSGEA
jgi:hypothetical protein